MFFLLRAAFWLTLVLALLPSGGAQPVQGPQVSAIDAVAAAGTAVSDMSNFCDRQAEACVVGAQAAVAIGQRAQAGARMVYEFINDRMATSETGSVPDVKGASTRNTEAKVLPAAMSDSQNTLKPADLEPNWRRPAPRGEAQPRRDKHPA